ncbi:MAG: tetratricopeptide repeat protein [Pseudomonadales bacterium]
MALIDHAAAQQQEHDLATLFSLDPLVAEEEFNRAKGEHQHLLGLVLADSYGTTSPSKALEQLQLLATAQSDDVAIGGDGAKYETAIRCSISVRQGQLAQAISLCGQIADTVEDVEDEFVRARVLASLHFLNIRQGTLEKSVEMALRVEQLAAKIGNPYLEATALNASALTFSFCGLHAQAISRFERARRKLKNYRGRPLDKMISFNLGLAYRESGDHEIALQSFREGLEWAESTAQSHRTFIGQVEVANTLNQLERARESINLLEPALNDTTTARDPDTLIHAHLAIGTAEVAIENYERAIQYLRKGLALAEEYTNPRRYGQLRLVLIEALNSLGRSDQALAEAKDLSVLLRESQPNDELDDALDLLARLEADSGNYEEALRHHIEARRMSEQAQGASFERKLILLEVSDQIERANRESVLAQAQAKTLQAQAGRNRVIAVGGAIFLFGALVLFALDQNRRRKKRELVEHLHNSELLEQLVERRTSALEEQMTERMRGEEDRRKLEQELAEGDKLRSLGQLTGGVAHDFNNLLTVVSGAADLLEHDPDMPVAKRRELVRAILEAAESGSEINIGLLAYARQQRLNPELIDLEEFFEKSRSLFQRTLGEGMVLEVSAASLTIEVDGGQLATAIINLLTNAREASDSRGKVLITVAQNTEGAPDNAAITVRDWGCGMTDSETTKAIEPFYSTKDATIVSGLGLSRVYGFVQQSGGHLEIKSEPTTGTTVTLTFPITSKLEQNEKSSNSTRTQHLRILLVDDNGEVGNMVEKMLESLGHFVITAKDGEQALRLLEQDKPDLLITDVLMPGELGGKELAQEVRSREPQIPILMISGFAEAADLDFPLLAKPFRLEDLDAALLRLFTPAS